jgi:hypothetical protein
VDQAHELKGPRVTGPMGYLSPGALPPATRLSTGSGPSSMAPVPMFGGGGDGERGANNLADARRYRTIHKGGTVMSGTIIERV